MQRVLDSGMFVELGCGTGDVVGEVKSRYPHVAAVGVDIRSEYMKEAKRRHPSATFVNADLRSLPFADCSIPYLFSWRIYQYDNENCAPDILAEAFRVLRPDGIYLLGCEFFDEDRLAAFHRQIGSAGFEVAVRRGWDYAVLVKSAYHRCQ
ncbi:MAG: class I SAM-dependent methyltransferase [Candidatus Aenigmarchaeota archaeon]|nr:class I SAM-dependent methyltransferase [Candidatus Aenigmarchaeota archaeon]